MSLEQVRRQQQVRHERLQQGPIADAMAQVRHKVAIISGKGGVGKTSLTANLAAALQQRGSRVGVFDADIHGPGVPRVLGVEVAADALHGAYHIRPPKSREGIKVMSIALLWPGEYTPTMWRGPYKMRVIRQLLSAAKWNELDYLLVDLPPGTGDEILAIMEAIPALDGVVVITTPQEVATTVCGKAITAAREMDVRVLGVVENMAMLRCPHCGEEITLFGSGGGEVFARTMDTPFLGRIPFDRKLVEASEDGFPVVSRFPDAESARAIGAVAGRLVAMLEVDGWSHE